MSARLSISIHEPPWPELESGIREGNYRSLSLSHFRSLLVLPFLLPCSLSGARARVFRFFLKWPDWSDESGAKVAKL